MAIPTRASRPGTFFITSGTYNRRRLFQVERNAQLLIETLQHYRAAGHYQLHAFVVMPDHIHLLLTPQETLERAIGLIKDATVKRYFYDTHRQLKAHLDDFLRAYNFGGWPIHRVPHSCSFIA